MVASRRRVISWNFLGVNVDCGSCGIVVVVLLLLVHLLLILVLLLWFAFHLALVIIMFFLLRLRPFARLRVGVGEAFVWFLGRPSGVGEKAGETLNPKP